MPPIGNAPSAPSGGKRPRRGSARKDSAMDLDRQAELNAERLKRDMAEGLRELLDLHNSEELKICRTLGASGKGPAASAQTSSVFLKVS